jgi:hypothetical protein
MQKNFNSNKKSYNGDRPRANAVQGNQGYRTHQQPAQYRAGRTEFVPRISLVKVNSLLEKKPDEIILSISDARFDFSLYLNAERMGEELLTKLLTVIEKAYQCNSFRTKLISLTDQILESKFFKEHVYTHLQIQLAPGVYKTGFITSVLRLCSTFIFLEPLVVDKLDAVRDRLELLIKVYIRDPALDQLWAEFVQLGEEAKKKRNIYKNRTFTNIVNQDALEPPNDFTQMNIVPTLIDIVHDQETFLRKNITNGAYNSVHHYLDVQFRLLREDFLQPLRNGVKHLRSIVEEAHQRNNLNDFTGNLSKDVVKQIKRIESLNVYFDIRMNSCVPTDFGIVYSMKLNLDKMKMINWEHSKRLIFGSMVCLSCDYFSNNCLVGIITERDDKKLKEDGEIYIRFDHNNFHHNLPVINVSYIMLETSAFFEAYKHVLEALVSFQRHGEDNFPFKENLVDCQNQVMPVPKYLTTTSIDFRFEFLNFVLIIHILYSIIIIVNSRPLIVTKEKLKCKLDRDGFLTYEFPKELNYAEKCFINNAASWPTAENLGLDKSQYDAVQLALKSKLALIQG